MPFTSGKFNSRERERERDFELATRKIAGGEGEKNDTKRENDMYGTVVDEKAKEREREGGGSRRGWWPARSGPFGQSCCGGCDRATPPSLATLSLPRRLSENTGRDGRSTRGTSRAPPSAPPEVASDSVRRNRSSIDEAWEGKRDQERDV